MTALIDLFPPERTEGPIEYLRRLSLRNGYRDWRSLVRAAGLNPSLNALWKNKPTLTDALGLDPTWLDAVMPPGREDAGLHEPYFRRASTDAVCPTCLAKSACLNHAWSHSLVSACPEHESALIDTCPSCCETLSPTRFDLATCDCGYALTEAAAKRATPFEIWVSARLAGDMRSIDGLPEIGSPADYKGLARLLFSLAVRLDPRAKGKPAKVSRPHDLGHTQALLASIWPLFAQWPHGFNAHVRARLAAGNRKSFSPSGRLGGWYTTLLALTAKAGAFGPVWVAFSDAMIEHFDGNLRGQQLLTPSPGRLRRYVSMKEAAQLIGVTQPFLLAAIEKGSVQGHVTIRGVAYTQAMMVRDEADRIKAARAEWTSEPHASDIFGVPVSVIRGLCKAGVIEAKPDWQTDILRAGPIRTASLGALVRKLAGVTENRRENDILTFAQLTAKRTTDVSALTKLYKAIEAGEVRPVAYDVEHSLGGFIFAASEIRAYVGSAALAEGMTLAQLEKAAGWKYDAIAHWCREGLLDVSEVMLHGRAARLISNTALAAFRREWIPVTDLAKSLGTKSSALTSKILQRGLTIHGQLSLPSGAKRGGLLRLADIAALL